MIVIQSKECFEILMANLYKMKIDNHSRFMNLVKSCVGYRINDNVIILRNLGEVIEITYMEAKGKAKVHLLNKAKSLNKPLVYTGITNCIPNNSTELSEGIYCIK